MRLNVTNYKNPCIPLSIVETSHKFWNYKILPYLCDENRIVERFGCLQPR